MADNARTKEKRILVNMIIKKKGGMLVRTPPYFSQLLCQILLVVCRCLLNRNDDPVSLDDTPTVLNVSLDSDVEVFSKNRTVVQVSQESMA